MPRTTAALDVVPAGTELTHAFRQDSGALGGKTVVAVLETNGDVRIVRGLEGTGLEHLYQERFRDLSPAAEVLRGNRPTNGWTFWKVDGVAMSQLRDGGQRTRPPSVAESPGDTDSVSGTVSTRTQLADAELDDAVAEQMRLFIDSVVETFARERSRYQEILDQVMALIPDLSSDRPVAVQQRVKMPKSLRDKLGNRWERRADSRFVQVLREVEDAYRMELSQRQVTSRRDGMTVMRVPSDTLGGIAVGRGARTLQQSTLDEVPDLAGVRIIVYRKDDLAHVLLAVKRKLTDLADMEEGDPTRLYLSMTKSSKEFSEETSGTYVADHLRIVYRADGAEDPMVHLDGAQCEIQITTMTQHLLNEVGHDVLYKRRDGRTDNARVEGQLQTLGLVAESFDGVINALYKELDEAGPTASDTSKSRTRKREGRLAAQLFPRPKRFSEAERCARWVNVLTEYAILDPQPDESTRQASIVLKDRSSLEEAARSRNVDVDQLASEYQDVYSTGELDNANGRKTLNPNDPDHRWILTILGALPEPYLRAFVKSRGSRTPAPGRPPLIVNIAEAFLLSQKGTTRPNTRPSRARKR